MDEPLLFETIRIQNGRVRNIKYHNQRCNFSRKSLFGSTNKIDLRQVIDTSEAISAEVKCRITYSDVVKKVEYEAYAIRPIESLAFIEIGDFEYSFKFADRDTLNDFFDQRGDNDDILMTRNGFVTDTYYANVALLKNDKWYTPKNPLFEGTRRAKLIFEGKIVPSKIHIDQIFEFEAIVIFNAMIPFKKIVINLKE